MDNEPINNQPPAPVTPPSPSNGPKHRHWLRLLGGLAIVVVILALTGFGGYYLAQHKKGTPAGSQPLSNDQPSNEAAAPQLPPEPTGTDVASTYKVSGIVQWQNPEKIAAVTAFDIKDSDPTYDLTYKVGVFNSGPYKGGDLIMGQGVCDCMGNMYYHAVKQGNTYTLLTKYSTNIDLDSGSSVDKSKFKVDSNYTLTDLEYPETLTGPAPRQQFTLQRPLFGILYIFKLNKNIKPAFFDQQVGQVYTTVENYDSDLTDNFRGNGFYFKAPDGTVVSYSLNVDFVGQDNIPQVTWNDGSQNKQQYAFQSLGGCGSQNYADVVTSQVKSSDLVSGGTNNKGDKIFLFRDADHPMLKDLYDNGYYVPEGQKKLSYNDFIKTRPYFFWTDPFGRLIRFKNTTFQPLAECGKPVIYLYPQHQQQVTVMLSPKGGFTYTEPPYGLGWHVWADPSGVLTDMATKQQYPYLFWEGRGGIYQTPSKGFVVARNDVPGFLDSKLAQLGLNQKESADFKEFWLPKMQRSPYYFVTFMGNSVMDEIAPLQIDPKPDTVIRVLMDFRELNQPISVQGYNIRTPKRQGFTVVEWGGVLH